MNRQLLIPAIFVCLFVVSIFSAFDAPVRAQGPVENAQATIFAATVFVQQTREARDADRAAQQATVIRLQVIQQEQTITRAAVDANETSIAKTATAQARATANANASATMQAQAIAQANATATARAELRATETAQAQASETARAEQIAGALVQKTQAAKATVTQQAYLAKQFENQLERERGITFAVGLGAFAGVSILFTVMALATARAMRLWHKPKPVVIEVASFERETTQLSTQPPDAGFDIPQSFEATAPVTISTDEDTALDLYERLRNACTIQSTPALPPATSS